MILEIKKFSWLALLVFALSSCASYHNGAISSGPLLSASDKHVKTAWGMASTGIFLGFGGTGYDALVHNAKAQMEKDYPLAAGEYYANYTVDFKRSILLLIYMKNEVFVHADIMSQNPSTVTKAVNDPGDPSINFYKTKTDSFYVGEHIYMNYDGVKQLFYSFNEFEISGFDKKGFVYLNFIEKGKTALVDRNLLYYSKNKVRNNLSGGDEVTFKHRGDEVKGRVLATAPDKALVSYDKGFYELKYSEITKTAKQ